MDNNPLKCDCEIFWFSQWLLNGDSNSSVQVSGICQEPPSLFGKTLYELDGNYLRELGVCRKCQLKVKNLFSIMLKWTDLVHILIGFF